MKCKYCGGKTKVTNTVDVGHSVYRRLRCKKCPAVYYTVEEFTEDEEKIYEYRAVMNLSRRMRKSNV